MKKIMTLLLALAMILAMAACAGDDIETTTTQNSTTETTTSQTTETTATEETTTEAPKVKGWDDSAVAENLKEDFAKLTAGVPQPHVAYTINVVSMASGLMFDFPNEQEVATWKQIIQIEGDFRYVEEKLGIIYYENATHTIKISGHSITLKLK